MAIKLTETNGGKILEILASGKLVHQDYAVLVPIFERLIQEHGRISILFEMVDFHGWDAAAAWDDIKVDVKHFSDIAKLAMVGETKWEKGMSIFCRPFTTAKIKDLDKARAWVASGE
jgi:hypothetical protein